MRIRRLTAAVAAFGLVSTVALSSASAMTTGASDDGNQHPAVTATVIVSPDGNWATLLCSGMLIRPMVVLTASHCNVVTQESWYTSRGYTLGITNLSELPVPQGEYWFAWNGQGQQADVTNVHLNPLYRGGYRNDVSLLEIAHPLDGVDGDDLPTLPPAGLLDDLEKRKALRTTPSLVIGYGSEQQVIPALGGQFFPDTNKRKSAELGTTAIDKQGIHQSQRVTQGAGGACYGDSGGPTLMTVEGTTYIAGVTSTGDMPCFATNVAGRVDAPDALAYIDSVIAP